MGEPTIPVFRPKRRKKATRWGGTYLYSLYKGVLLGAGCSPTATNFIVCYLPKITILLNNLDSADSPILNYNHHQ